MDDHHSHAPALPFRHFLRVRYSECDAQKVVFNSRYTEYVDVAFTEFMRALGYGAHAPDSNPELQLVKHTIEWRSSARFDDVLEIRVEALRLGTTSVTMRCEMRRAGEDALLAQTETVYVHVDPHSFNKAPIPARLREALQRGAPGVQVDHGHVAGASSAAAGVRR